MSFKFKEAKKMNSYRIFCLIILFFTANYVCANTAPELIISDITCTGNTYTRCNYIVNKFYQGKGDIVDQNEIDNARLRLSTLSQFRSIRVRLEKGEHVGHVVVVFIVQEASQVQYQISGSYGQSNSEIDDGDYSNSNSFRSTYSATNYNFLGSGKTLRLSIDSSIASRSGVYASFTGFPKKYESQSQSATIGISYMDPNLLGSSDYYGSVIYHFDTSHSSYSYENEANRKTNNNGYYLSTHIGRYIADFSYVSIAVNKTQDNDPTYKISYGWSTTDDYLLPTEGSQFANTYTHQAGTHRISTNYLHNAEFVENNIVTYGAAYYLSKYDAEWDLTLSSTTSLYAKYTHINQKDDGFGRYSGWYVGASVYRGLSGSSSISSAFFAGYVYQTNDLILNVRASLESAGDY